MTPESERTYELLKSANAAAIGQGVSDHECQVQRLTIITTLGDHMEIVYCLTGRHLMAAATSKTILFAQARHDKKLYTHPVAVFANVKDAKAYATFLKLAHRAGDKDAALALDPQTHLTAEGVLIPDTKWSVLDVPYAPSPNFPEDDDTEGGDTLTS